MCWHELGKGTMERYSSLGGITEAEAERGVGLQVFQCGGSSSSRWGGGCAEVEEVAEGRGWRF